jgi:glycosyltransferase involved in cell wall biosynthesis
MAGTAAQPSTSVVICAYTLDRWRDLLAAIESVRDETSDGEVVVVVDHNDELRRRLEAEFDDLVVVANEGPRGLSGARNTGVAAASGEIVAFLDDDAVADAGWLEHLRTCFADPAVAGAGGSVEPRWSDRRPRWFPEEFDWVVGCTYRGLPTVTAPIRNPIGANMALRRGLVNEVGGFTSSLGRGGTNTMGCEETDLFIRARQRFPSSTWLFEPTARVRHRVPTERATFRYFVQRCYGEGKSKALLVGRVGTSSGLESERSYVLHVLPAGVLRGLRDPFVQRRPDGWVRAAAIVIGFAATTAGYARGRFLYRFRRPTIASAENRLTA